MASEHGWGIIFDVDGTMVDTADFHERSWVELGLRKGLPITREYYREHIHGKSNEVIVRELAEATGEAEADLQAVADEKEIVFRELYRPHVKPLPGLDALMEAIAAAGVPCAAVTNAPLANGEMVLEVLGYRGRFAVVLAPDCGLAGKPAPDMFFEAARRMGVPISRCLVLEDSRSGFEAAENARAPYVAITGAAWSDHAEHARHAEAVFTDYTAFNLGGLRELAFGYKGG